MVDGCLMLSGVGVRLRTNADLVFQCGYHVVWCPKYRRRGLGGRVARRLDEVIVEIANEHAGPA